MADPVGADRKKGTHNRTITIAAAIVGTAAALALLYFLRGIIIPLVVAAVLVVLVQSLVRAI